jgi:hypothetical protein
MSHTLTVLGDILGGLLVFMLWLSPSILAVVVIDALTKKRKPSLSPPMPLPVKVAPASTKISSPLTEAVLAQRQSRNRRRLIGFGLGTVLLIAAPFVGLPDKAKLAQNISHLSSQEAHQGVTFAWTPIAPDRLAVHFNDAWQQSHGQLIDRAGFYDLSGQYYDHFVAQRLHAGYSYVAAHRCEVDLFLVDHQITRRTWTDYVVAES